MNRLTPPSPQRRRWFWLLLAAAPGVGVLLALLILAWRGTDFYLYPPRRHSSQTPADFGFTYQDVTLRTSDGVTLTAWYIPPQNGAVILIAHGFGSARDPRLFALFAEAGYGVVSWDFRVHGASGGERCTMGYAEIADVAAALDFALTQPGVEQVGALGESMGGATVIRTAARRPEIAAVAVEGAYPTLEAMLYTSVHPQLRLFVRALAELRTGISLHSVRPVDDIAHISPRPVFILQGEDDTQVLPESARQLYTAAGDPRDLWIEPGVGHAGLRFQRPEQYRERLWAFFDAALLQ